MLDLFAATLEQFEPYIGHQFVLHIEAGNQVLILEDARLLPKVRIPERLASKLRAAPFVLTWRGPLDHMLPQKMYSIEHPDPNIGMIDGIFLTCFGQSEAGYRYESVFN